MTRKEVAALRCPSRRVPAPQLRRAGAAGAGEDLGGVAAHRQAESDTGALVVRACVRMRACACSRCGGARARAHGLSALALQARILKFLGRTGGLSHAVLGNQVRRIRFVRCCAGTKLPRARASARWRRRSG